VPASDKDIVFGLAGRTPTRRARARSSGLLIAVFLLGAVAALLSITALIVLPPDFTTSSVTRIGLALIAAGAALALLAGAFGQRRLTRAAERDCAVLKRTIEVLRRREAYDEAQSALMAHISGLIETFTRTRNLEAVLQQAARVLQATLHADCLVLQLYDDQAGRVSLAIEEGGSHTHLGESIHRDVIGRGKSVLVNQTASSAGLEELAQQGYSSLMAAPLGRGRRTTDRSVGLVAALNRANRDFTGHELSLLSHFARHAGLIIENAQLYKQAEHLAEHDGLTDLYNHRRFVETLNTEIANASMLGAPVSLIMADLDNFKHYNDTHGHPKGDLLLRQIARILMDNTRQRDIVARYGGEEFVVILPITGSDGARRVAETIRAQIESFHFPGEERSGKITITLGVAVFPDDAATTEDLIQRADDALYRAKREGKNRVAWAAPPAPEDARPDPK